eukprot:symbB.v1.2.013764.t1/scaffold982.1/size146904/6
MALSTWDPLAKPPKWGFPNNVDVASLTHDNIVLTETAQRYESEKVQSEVEIADVKDMLNAKRTEEERETRRRDRLESELIELKQNMETRDRVLRQVKAEIQQQAEVKAATESKLDGQKNAIHVLRNAEANWQRQIGELKRQKQECGDAKKKLIEENHQLDKTLKERHEEIRLCTADRDKTKKALDALKRRKALDDEARHEMFLAKAVLKTETENLIREIDMLKKQAETDSKTITDILRDRESLNRALIRCDDRTKDQAKKVKSHDEEAQQLERDVDKIKLDVQDAIKKAYKLDKTREKYGLECSLANSKYMSAVEELKNRDNKISELRKNFADVKAKLAQQKQLYEAVRTDRNLYSKKLVESQDEIAEMKRKFKIMSHQIEQLKEEIKEKEERLKRGHHQHNRMQKECEYYKDQLERAKRRQNNLTSNKETQQAEIKKLESRIQEEEDRRKQQKKKYEETISQRDVLGTQLIHRNDELALQYEKIKIQQKTLQNGELAYKQRLEESRALCIKLAQLKRELHIGKQQVLNIDDLKREVFQLQRELLQERTKVKALSEELENPMNVHRMSSWRLRLCLDLVVLLSAQQVDPKGDEDTKNAGIRISVNGQDTAQFVMLDSRWRWLYNVDDKDCGSLTTDPATLERCYLQGLRASKYADGYGVLVGSPTNRALTLRYATKDKDSPSPNYGSRVYLTDGEGYTLFSPMAGEISFDVDISQVPAGMNAAVYLVSMNRYGNIASISNSGVMNVAGWRRGLGYCDAQCPTDLRFVQDAGLNSDNRYASCCPEMDTFR